MEEKQNQNMKSQDEQKSVDSSSKKSNIKNVSNNNNEEALLLNNKSTSSSAKLNTTSPTTTATNPHLSLTTNLNTDKDNTITTSNPHYESQASKDFSFFLQQQKDSSQRALISPQVRFVMFQFLFTTVKPFTSEFLTKNVLELIFKRAIIKESRRLLTTADSTASKTEYLYKYGKGCNYFILILSGEAIIEVGQEKLEFPAGPFAYFGVNALLCGRETPEQIIQEDSSNQSQLDSTSLLYVPDFSLRVDDRCVYLKIDRGLWRNGVIKSNYERVNNHISDSIDYIPSANMINNYINADDYLLLEHNNNTTTPLKPALNNHPSATNSSQTARRSTFNPDLLSRLFSNKSQSNKKINLSQKNLDNDGASAHRPVMIELKDVQKSKSMSNNNNNENNNLETRYLLRSVDSSSSNDDDGSARSLQHQNQQQQQQNFLAIDGCNLKNNLNRSTTSLKQNNNNNNNKNGDDKTLSRKSFNNS
jgi:hypothetical protein